MLLRNISTYLSLIVMMTLISCAHYPDVRPGKKEHKVVAYHESETESYQYAMAQAKDFCDDVYDGKRPIITAEQTKFTGEDREGYEKARLVKGVAGSLGAFGTGKIQKAGQVVGSADIGKPYETTILFECK